MSDVAKAFSEKFTFANFIKYFGPGLVLYALLRLSGEGRPSGDSVIDSLAIVLGLIVLGLLLQQLCQVFIFGPFVCRLKDGPMARKWENRRQKIQRLCAGQKLTSRDAEWIWGQIKNTGAVGRYSPAMNAWAALIGLLYLVGFVIVLSGTIGVVMTTVSWMARGITTGSWGSDAGYWAGGIRWLLGELFALAICIAIGVVVFIGGLLSDTEFERWEAYRHCPKDEELKELVRPVIESSAFAR
jgi:hypothetical protein